MADQIALEIIREGVVVEHAHDHITVAFPADGAVFGEFSTPTAPVGDPFNGSASGGGYASEYMIFPTKAQVGQSVILPGTRIDLKLEVHAP